MLTGRYELKFDQFLENVELESLIQKKSKLQKERKAAC